MTWVRCVPLDAWTGPRTTQRRRAPFAAGWARIFDDLERELELLDGALALALGQPSVLIWAGRSMPMRASVAHWNRNGPWARLEGEHDRRRPVRRLAGQPSAPSASPFNASASSTREASPEAASSTEGSPPSRPARASTTWRTPPGSSSNSPGVTVDVPNLTAMIEGGPFRTTAHRLAAKKAHPDQGGSSERFAQLQVAMKVLEGVKR